MGDGRGTRVCSSLSNSHTLTRTWTPQVLTSPNLKSVLRFKWTLTFIFHSSLQVLSTMFNYGVGSYSNLQQKEEIGTK